MPRDFSRSFVPWREPAGIFKSTVPPVWVF